MRSAYQTTLMAALETILFDGRGGYDVAVYNVDGAVTSGISANMAAGTVTGGAAIGTDTLIAVEVGARHELCRYLHGCGICRREP